MSCLIKTLLVINLIVILTSRSEAQTNFIDGFIILNTGEKISGKIDFQGWDKNPHKILFRLNNNEVEEYEPADIRSFFASETKYISREVNIDTTPHFSRSETRQVLPSLIRRKVFLKVLVEGEISLYQFKGVRENFYLESEGSIAELISHRFLVKNNGKLLISTINEEEYLTTLGETCDLKKDGKVYYESKALQKFVIDCNEENNQTLNYVYKHQKPIVKHGLIIGYEGSSLAHSYDLNTFYLFALTGMKTEDANIKYESTLGITLGYKVKILLPGSLRRNALFFSLDYSKYSYNSKNQFRDFITLYEGFAEAQTISDVQIKFSSLDFIIGYMKKTKPGSTSSYIKVGFLLSKNFNRSSTAYFQSSLYDSERVLSFETPLRDLPVLGVVEEVRSFDYQVSSLVGGVTGSLGWVFGKIYTEARVEIRRNRGFSHKHNSMSFILGYDF